MWKLATRKHYEYIMDMCRELYKEDPSSRPVPKSHIEKTLEELLLEPTRGRAVVLEMDGKIVGYSLLISFWSNELGGEVCIIDELYVRPVYRGRGFASHLIRELMEGGSIGPQPLVAIDLEVTPKNTKATKLYSKLGFKPAKNSHMRWSADAITGF